MFVFKFSVILMEAKLQSPINFKVSQLLDFSTSVASSEFYSVSFFKHLDSLFFSFTQMFLWLFLEFRLTQRQQGKH